MSKAMVNHRKKCRARRQHFTHTDTGTVTPRRPTDREVYRAWTVYYRALNNLNAH